MDEAAVSDVDAARAAFIETLFDIFADNAVLEAVVDEKVRGYEAAIRAESGGPGRSITMHTCWDDHEGPDGTHLDGSPCLDKPVRYVESAGTLDVERLARAFDLNGVNWPKRWGDNDFVWLARQVAAEYARLTEADR